MPTKHTKTPKSPRLSLPSAIEKALVLFDKEQLHAVPPDIMAQHLGYKDSKNGAAATVLGTLRMYGLITKAHNRRDQISESVKRYKFTPYDHEKAEIAENWLATPRLYQDILSKYEGTTPSEAAFRYDLIQEFAFTEGTANKFMRQFNESEQFVNELRNVLPQVDDSEVSDDVDSDDLTQDTEISDKYDESPLVDFTPDEKVGAYSVHIRGPGINSNIAVNEEDDLLIVEVMLNKIRKKVAE